MIFFCFFGGIYLYFGIYFSYTLKIVGLKQKAKKKYGRINGPTSYLGQFDPTVGCFVSQKWGCFIESNSESWIKLPQIVGRSKDWQKCVFSNVYTSQNLTYYSWLHYSQYCCGVFLRQPLTGLYAKFSRHSAVRRHASWHTRTSLRSLRFGAATQSSVASDMKARRGNINLIVCRLDSWSQAGGGIWGFFFLGVGRGKQGGGEEGITCGTLVWLLGKTRIRRFESPCETA